MPTVADPGYPDKRLKVSSRLYAGHTFFVTQKVSQRSLVIDLIRAGGGRHIDFITNQSKIDYYLVPDFPTGNTRQGALRATIVADAARSNVFPPLGNDLRKYLPFTQQRQTRNDYTSAEIMVLESIRRLHFGNPPMDADAIRNITQLIGDRHSAQSIKSKLKEMAKTPLQLEPTPWGTYTGVTQEDDPPALNVPRNVPTSTIATPANTRFPDLDSRIQVPDTPVKAPTLNTVLSQSGVADTPRPSQATQSSSGSSQSHVTDSPSATYKNPAITEIPATPTAPEIQVPDSAGKKPVRKTGRAAREAKQKFEKEAAKSQSTVMMPSPKKQRDRLDKAVEMRELSSPKKLFTQVEQSSSPSSTRFTSTQIPKSSSSTGFYNGPVFGTDSDEITESQVLTPLVAPESRDMWKSPDLSQSRDKGKQRADDADSTMGHDGSGESDSDSRASPESHDHLQERMARMERIREQAEKSRDKSRDSNSTDSTDSAITPSRRRTRSSSARQSLHSRDQTRNVGLFPRVFQTRTYHVTVPGVIYGLERLSSRSEVTSSQSFVEDSQVVVRESRESRETMHIHDLRPSMIIPDTQENPLERDAQGSYFDDTNDITSVSDTQHPKRPSHFPNHPLSNQRRFGDSSLGLDVSVRSLPSVESIKARYDSLSREGAGDILGSLAETRIRGQWGRLTHVTDHVRVEKEVEVKVEVKKEEEEVAVSDQVSSESYTTSESHVSAESHVTHHVKDEPELSDSSSSDSPVRVPRDWLTTPDIDSGDDDSADDAHVSIATPPPESRQVVVPVRKPAVPDSVFRFEDVTYEDVVDDRDYDPRTGWRPPMSDSQEQGDFLDSWLSILQPGVAHFLGSLQGHDPEVARNFAIAVVISGQVDGDTTYEEVQEMEIRYPRHAKFFSPLDDEVLLDFLMTGEVDERMDVLQQRHEKGDIVMRSEFLGRMLETVDEAVEEAPAESTDSSADISEPIASESSGSAVESNDVSSSGEPDSATASPDVLEPAQLPLRMAVARQILKEQRQLSRKSESETEEKPKKRTRKSEGGKEKKKKKKTKEE